MERANYVSRITTIEQAQKRLAFDDAQSYIYENSTLNTLAFSGANAVKNLHTYCINEAPKVGELFEFGVFKGKSLTYFAKILLDSGDSRIINGFDSFRGFSEEWSGVNEQYEIGTFDLHSKLPNVPENTRLVDGYIEDTLQMFVKENDIGAVAFIHIDTDTYTPAKVILETLKPYFKSGTIILFDELLGYPNWRSHEFRALGEVLNRDEFEYLGFAHNTKHAFLIKAAIRIL